jgi:hypothetical protein
MFWNAVGSGLSVLLHYQVWIGAALVVLLSLGSMLLLTRATVGSTPENRSPAGCLTTMVGGTLVQGVAVSAYLTLIMPIILGGRHLTPLAFVSDHAGTVVTAGVLGIMAILFVGFIPILGGSATFGTFVQGVVVCRVLAGSTLDYAASHRGAQVAYPGLFASIGFVVIAFALSRLTLVVVAVAAKESWAPVIAPPLGLVFGLLPAFMYMRYAVMPILS